jgi:hypothetical protein
MISVHTEVVYDGPLQIGDIVEGEHPTGNMCPCTIEKISENVFTVKWIYPEPIPREHWASLFNETFGGLNRKLEYNREWKSTKNVPREKLRAKSNISGSDVACGPEMPLGTWMNVNCFERVTAKTHGPKTYSAIKEAVDSNGKLELEPEFLTNLDSNGRSTIKSVLLQYN